MSVVQTRLGHPESKAIIPKIAYAAATRTSQEPTPKVPSPKPMRDPADWTIAYAADGAVKNIKNTLLNLADVCESK